MDISLALGGGGSRGYAHIGVLRCLERGGYRIKAISGTSAGGIVAVAYAAGRTPDEMEAAFTKIDQSKLFARSADEGPGILGLSGATKLFEDFFGDRTFAELRFPCAVVAVDLKAGREVILSQGRVVDALLATIAVPGVFPPRQYGDTQLVDGAVLNPVPVCVARSLAPDLPVVAVVLETQPESGGGLNGIPLPVQMPARVVERLTRTRVAQAFNLFLQSVDVGSRKMAELRLISDAPDVIIRPDVRGIGLLDQVDVQMVARKGEDAAEAVLPELRRALTWPNRLRRKIFQQK
jgi:NTE family protein